MTFGNCTPGQSNDKKQTTKSGGVRGLPVGSLKQRDLGTQPEHWGERQVATWLGKEKGKKTSRHGFGGGERQTGI